MFLFRLREIVIDFHNNIFGEILAFRCRFRYRVPGDR